MINLLLPLTLLGLGSAIADKDDCYGCPVQLDPKSPQVLKLADKVIAKVQAYVSLPNCLFREEVYNATSQFFASYEYHLTFSVGHSKCEQPNCAQKIKQADCQHASSFSDMNIKGVIWYSPNGEEQVTYEILK